MNLQKTNLTKLSFAALFIFNGLVGNMTFGSKTSVFNLKTANSSLAVNSPITGYKGTLDIEVPTASSVVSANPVNVIVFSQGGVITGQNSFTLTGTYAGSQTINMGAGDVLDIASGTVTQSVFANGTTGSPTVIRGQPIFSNVLTVNASSFLSLELQNDFAQNIALSSSGTVVLNGDLTFASGFFFTGNGNVNINGFKLNLPANPTTAWTNTLTFTNAKNVNLFGYTKLTGTWNFSDAGGISFLNGNGNILDLTGGGTIQVASNHTLYITNCDIKGLGASNGAFSLNVVNGTVKLTNTTLELAANYTHSAGQIYINGANCQLVYGQPTGSNYTFAVTSTGTLTVDRETFFYDSLASQAVYPFTFTSQSTQLNIINDGVIAPFTSPGTEALVIDETASSPTLSTNIYLTSATPFNLTNSGGTAIAMTVNGSGYTMQFPTAGSSYLTLGNLLTVNFTNMVFRDYNPGVITYGTSSLINFGNGCLIQLAQDLVIGTALTFTGTATIDARGKNITVGSNSQISVTGGNTLTIKNANIYLNAVTGISCAFLADKVIFSNCNVYVGAAGFTWALGNIDIDGLTVFQGCNATTPLTTTAFTYSSPGAFRVLTDSTLKFLGNITFTYQANATVNADTLAQSKRHFRMFDPSASIIFSGCSLVTTATGLAFDYGNLIFEDRVAGTVNTGTNAELDFGSSLNLFLRSGATLEVDGPMAYNTTTFTAGF